MLAPLGPCYRFFFLLLSQPKFEFCLYCSLKRRRLCCHYQGKPHDLLRPEISLFTFHKCQYYFRKRLIYSQRAYWSINRCCLNRHIVIISWKRLQYKIIIAVGWFSVSGQFQNIYALYTQLFWQTLSCKGHVIVRWVFLRDLGERKVQQLLRFGCYG